MARKTTCITETSVTKYISARADGTEEKGPAMPRLKAPCGHREIQSRHKVQRREMRQAPPPREMERSRQAPGACLPDAHAPRGQPAQQTGGQPHGAKPAAIFPHTVFGTFLPGKWSRESYGERRRQGIPQRNAPHGQKEGNPYCHGKMRSPISKRKGTSASSKNRSNTETENTRLRASSGTGKFFSPRLRHKMAAA